MTRCSLTARSFRAAARLESCAQPRRRCQRWMRAGRAGLFLRLNMETTLRSKSLRVLHLYVDVTLWELCLGAQASMWMFLSVHAFIQPHTHTIYVYIYIYIHTYVYVLCRSCCSLYMYNVAAVAVCTGTDQNIYCDYTSSRQCQRHR
jgi:hypothetical protein